MAVKKRGGPKKIKEEFKEKIKVEKKIDPVNLQFPKPKIGMPFGILRNRARNIQKISEGN